MSSNLKDYQRQKLYDWENANVYRGRFIPFDYITTYVARVWEAEGLKHPPLVDTVGKNCRRKLADGCRSKVRFRAEGAHESVILHELAHAMTCNVDDTGDWHGPEFVGTYMRLLYNHMNVPLFALWFSATQAGLDFVKKL